MTSKEFFNVLSTIKGWRLKNPYGYSYVRRKCGRNEYCPVTSVARRVTRKTFAEHEYEKAAKAIGLKRSTAIRIAEAADNIYGECVSRRVANKLLRATRLDRV